MDKILITGGGGFIGAFLAEKLVNMGLEVTVFDNFFRGVRKNVENVRGKAKIVTGDVRDKEVLGKAARDTDTIFHLAAIQGTKNFYEIPVKVLKVNVEGTIGVLEACIKKSVEKVVFASSSEVYGTPQYFPINEKHPLTITDIVNPRFSYAASKIVGESLCFNYAKTYGIKVVILRYFNVYGPRMGYDHVIPQFITRIVGGDEFTAQGDGSQTRSFCYVSDAVNGTVSAAQKIEAENQIFNIGNPEEVTINKLILLLEKIAKSKFTPKFIPLPEGGTRRRVPDISKARQILRYEPEVPLIEGLKITYDWYKKVKASECKRA